MYPTASKTTSPKWKHPNTAAYAPVALQTPAIASSDPMATIDAAAIQVKWAIGSSPPFEAKRAAATARVPVTAA